MTSLLICVAAMGCAITGGVLYGFSSFVMRALAQLPAGQGVAAMNSINRAVITPSFMVAFVGTALLAVGLAVAVLATSPPPQRTLVIAAAVLYAVGCFGVTMGVNQPMNLALAAMPADRAAAYWPEYVARWLRWNHVRTAAALAAAALFVASLGN
jgi:uncharacterized membrane protein